VGSDRVALAFVVITSALGGFFKVLGGVLYGSKAVFVDALTSIANLFALLVSIAYLRKSLEPPDKDHHFGHYRMVFGGSITTLMTYSFIAGIALIKLTDLTKYSVAVEAPLMAFLGVLAYSASILTARKLGGVLTHYAIFTVSELIEGAVVIFSSLVGALYSYLVDYAGALFLTLYIFYELRKVFSEVVIKLSDVAPSETILRSITRAFESEGLTVVDLKLRHLNDEKIHGVALISVSSTASIGDVEAKVNKVKKKLIENYGVDLTVEYSSKESGQH